MILCNFANTMKKAKILKINFKKFKIKQRIPIISKYIKKMLKIISKYIYPGIYQGRST